MYTPMNLSEYAYGNQAQGIQGSTGISANSSTVAAGTTTVPEKGSWIGSIGSWITQGANAYASVQNAITASKGLTTPQYSTLTPTLVTTQAAQPGTAQTGSQSQPIFPFNTVVLGSPTGSQGTQTTATSAAIPQVTATVNWQIIAIAAAVIVGVILLLRRR